MISECKTDAEVASTFHVMQQLRPHLDEISYPGIIQDMFKENFRLIGFFEDGQCLGVMGFRIETRLVRGRIIYVDDLVVDEAGRSKGVGKRLMDWIEYEARSQGIEHIILDSGTHRHAAHKFYLREGFHISAFNFVKKL